MTAELKRCSICKEHKDPACFNRRTGAKDGLQHKCRECSSRLNSAWRDSHPGDTAIADRRRRYGLTHAGFTQMLQAQQNRCAICAQTLVEPHLDHDHATGLVRGILCRTCNVGLGMFADEESRLRSAIRYLAAHPQETSVPTGRI